MENETGTSEAREAPAQQPDAVVSPSRDEQINAPSSDGGAPDGAQPAVPGQPGATGPKKRRRGRRGGKRHRRKTPGAATTTGEQPSGTAPSEDGAEATPKPRAPRPPRPQGQRQPRPRQPRPAASEASAVTPTAAESTGADTDLAAPTDEASADGKPAAPKRRRRRGGRGRGGKKPAGQGQQSAETAEVASAEAKPAPKPRSAPGSTRLAARELRKTQQQARGRRPRRRLTEEEARTLRGAAKTMLVHEHDDRTQIAVLEEGSLIEHFVARKGGKTSLAGNIFLGKVQNVLPGMEAAFVDFGRGRNGVLYAGEVNYSPEDLEGDASPRIEKVLKSGQALMVQVTKDPIGTKGARLTTQLSLAGRYMVLAPEQQLTGISRRLAENERARLRTILREIRPNGHGVIVRTAAEGATKEALERDLNNLIKIWDQIQKSAKKAKAPASLYEEPELVNKVVRDIFSGDFERVVVDSRAVYEAIKGYLDETAPDLLGRLELHQGALPLFEEFRVTEQLHKALERKVWLPSGGSLVIDRTEAMTVIDVNTGKFTGKGGNLEETVYKNNLEAAEEVARQLRLRDIGGIIVIDFIDMIDPKNQQELLRTLKRALSRDKTRSQVFEVSNLGLVEMTRKKVSEGLLDAFSEPCPNCEGRGIVLTHEID
ncbi:MAG TPA: Rne/Rng family ribonuclease [Actinomycetota bacterium]|nr:Rne/Rng family ribonuclease [Actinomycetota bacterium]